MLQLDVLEYYYRQTPLVLVALSRLGFFDSASLEEGSIRQND